MGRRGRAQGKRDGKWHGVTEATEYLSEAGAELGVPARHQG